MPAADFRRLFERWLSLLAYARRVNDAGGVARCERELTALSEAGARGAIAANLGWEMSAEKATVARDVQPLALPK